MNISEQAMLSHRPLVITATNRKSSLRDHTHSLQGSVQEFEGTSVAMLDDDLVMRSIGKREQLKRRFGSITILALSTVLLSSWEAVVAVLTAGLTNGGPVALVYGMLLTISGTLALACSLAELASQCAIAGATYQCTHMVAPRHYAPILTWMQGWITIFAWQATLTSVVYLTAIEIQAVAVLNNPGYVPERWHITLLMWALMLLMYIVNVRAFGFLPIVEIVGGVFHIAFFVCIVVSLLVLAKKNTARFVFTTFVNDGGWSKNGVSWCVGLLTVVWPFIGFDGVAHMSEETRDPTRSIPKVMIWTVIINAILAFSILLVVLFCIEHISAVTNTSTGFPFLEICFRATGSIKAATAMQCGLILIIILADLATLASVSRLTWAFARDQGLPFSKFFAHVNPHNAIPERSVALVTGIVFLLSLINIGSTTALNAVLSLSSIGLYISYLIPITLLLIKRLRNEPIAWGPFHLGPQLGFIVNIYAILYAVFICIFLPFPPYTPVTATNMNYAGPVFGSLIIVALLDWYFRGRKCYKGPIREDLNDPIQAVQLEALPSKL